MQNARYYKHSLDFQNVGETEKLHLFLCTALLYLQMNMSNCLQTLNFSVGFRFFVLDLLKHIRYTSLLSLLLLLLYIFVYTFECSSIRFIFRSNVS